MTEMSLAELKRVRLRLQKRKAKSKRRKDIARRKTAKKKVVWRKKLAARKSVFRKNWPDLTFLNQVMRENGLDIGDRKTANSYWYEPLAKEAAMLVFLNDGEKNFDRVNFGIRHVAMPL